MLCAPSNRRRPFSYYTKMADFEYFRILSVFSLKKNAINFEKCIEYGMVYEVLTVRSIEPQRGCPKRAELPDVNITTGAQSMFFDAWLVFNGYYVSLPIVP